MQWQFALLLLALFYVITAFFYTLFAWSRLDTAGISANHDELIEKYRNSNVNNLLLGSSINNIPGIRIQTSNKSIAQANRCSGRPLLINQTITGTINDTECVRICLNSNGKAIVIQNADESFIYDDKFLEPGEYCTVGPRPRCNLKTTIALVTLNSVVCRSRNSRVFGGVLGTEIVACNNNRYNDVRNVLYDNLRQKNVEVFDLIENVTEDFDNERMANGEYRYTCKFDGVDERQNKYQAHPKSRLHPVRNYCASELYAAHPDVKTIFDDAGNFRCDCGKFAETRVRNKDPNDPTSLCSAVIDSDIIIRNRLREKRFSVPCFTMFSPITDVGERLPCSAEKFDRAGTAIEEIRVRYSYRRDREDLAPIEHPLYESGEITGGIGSKIGLKYC